MSIWLILLSICLAGTLGGVINALINRSGFELPNLVKVDGVTVYKPGLLGNMLVSAAAAGVSWGFTDHWLTTPSMRWIPPRPTRPLPWVN